MKDQSEIGVIILAAGGSSRFGSPKPLILWGDQPLICHLAKICLSAAVDSCLVVTGFAAANVQEALEPVPIKVIYNPDWQDGQSSSIRAGVRSLPENVQAVIFVLADQPFLSVEIINALGEMYRNTGSPIIAPIVGGKRGNPVLFSRETFSALCELTGDTGGRSLFDQYPVYWMPWDDQRITLDIDVLSDLEKYRSGNYT